MSQMQQSGRQPPVTPEELMRYLDGEMAPDERERVDREIETSTELQREIAVYRDLKSDIQSLQFQRSPHQASVWDKVNTQLNRPIGWVLFVGGLAVWMTYGAWVFSTSSVSPWEKLGTGAIAIGVLMLLTSVIWERYRDWETDPYKDVTR
jgi:hypothetical protein